MTHHYPTPDAKGISETKEYFLRRHQLQLTDEEAYRVLFAIMRFLYLINTTPTPDQASPGATATN